MPAEHFLERARNIADRGFRPGSVDRELEQVALARIGRVSQGVKRAPDCLRIPFGAQALQFFDLACAHGGVVDLEDFDRLLVLWTVAVYANDHLRTGVDPRLRLRGGLFNAKLG